VAPEWERRCMRNEEEVISMALGGVIEVRRW
jgi:hypothetical protein